MTTKYRKEQTKYEEKKNKTLLKWDRESTITTLFICIPAIICILIINIDVKGLFIRNVNGWNSTCAFITSMDVKENMEQTREGNHYIVEGYIIKYAYKVNQKQYEDHIYLTSRSLRNKIITGRIYKGDYIEVLYKEDDPSESHLNIELDSNNNIKYCSN